MAKRKTAWQVAFERERRINGDKSHIEQELRTVTTYDGSYCRTKGYHSLDKQRKNGTISDTTVVRIPKENRAELRNHNKRKRLEKAMDCREVDKFMGGKQTFTPAPKKRPLHNIAIEEALQYLANGGQMFYDGTNYIVTFQNVIAGRVDPEIARLLRTVFNQAHNRMEASSITVNIPASAKPAKCAGHSVTRPSVDTAVQPAHFVAVFENHDKNLGVDADAEKARAHATLVKQLQDVPEEAVWRYLATGHVGIDVKKFYR